MPQINGAGLALIKSFEGCSLTAYPDPGTHGSAPTRHGLSGFDWPWLRHSGGRLLD